MVVTASTMNSRISADSSVQLVGGQGPEVGGAVDVFEDHVCGVPSGSGYQCRPGARAPSATVDGSVPGRWTYPTDPR